MSQNFSQSLTGRVLSVINSSYSLWSYEQTGRAYPGWLELRKLLLVDKIRADKIQLGTGSMRVLSVAMLHLGRWKVYRRSLWRRVSVLLASLGFSANEVRFLHRVMIASEKQQKVQGK